MSKAGKRLIEAAKEALAISRGEIEPAKVHYVTAGDEMISDTSGTKIENYKTRTVRIIAGKTLDDWKVFARRDDCLDKMVPSELRGLLAAIPPKP